MRDRKSRAVAVVIGAIALAIAGSVAGLSDAIAIEVRGRVEVPSDAAPAADTEDRNARRNRYWKVWNGFFGARTPRIDVARSVAVVLTGTGPGPESDFRIAGGNVMPSTLVARAGTTLRLDNRDSCSYELFSSDLTGFDAIQTAPGNARTMTLAAAGHYTIEDRNYAHVNAHLHVLPDLVARGDVDAEGRFVFTNVPAGSYTLKVFYEAREVASQPLEVVERRDALVLEPMRLNLSQATP